MLRSERGSGFLLEVAESGGAVDSAENGRPGDEAVGPGGGGLRDVGGVDAAVELFTETFYRHCAKLLGEHGILVPQSDSPTFYLSRVTDVYAKLANIFRNTSLYMGQVTAYPGGVWAYTAASQTIDVRLNTQRNDRIARLEPQLRYANAEFIQAAFALPTYVKRALAGEPGLNLPALGDDPAGFSV